MNHEWTKNQFINRLCSWKLFSTPVWFHRRSLSLSLFEVHEDCAEWVQDPASRYIMAFLGCKGFGVMRLQFHFLWGSIFSQTWPNKTVLQCCLVFLGMPNVTFRKRRRWSPRSSPPHSDGHYGTFLSYSFRAWGDWMSWNADPQLSFKNGRWLCFFDTVTVLHQASIPLLLGWGARKISWHFLISIFSSLLFFDELSRCTWNI